VVDYQIDFALESIKEDENRFIFTAKSITKDFVCEDGLNRLANDSPGKHLVWRHEHPLIPQFTSTHIYGRVLESKVKDGGIFSTYEVYGHTDDHLKVREVIKQRFELKDPIKISMRYRQYGTDNPIHFDVVEHSLTPTPACKECRAIEILNESDKMTEEELAKQIKELEEQLTKKDKLLEGYESKLETYNTKIQAIEKSLEEEIKSSKAKDKKLEETEKGKDEITEQLLEFKDKINGQSQMIEKLQEDNAMKGYDPLIKDLVELDGKEMEPIYHEKILEAYRKSKAGDKDILDKTLEFLKTRSKRLEGAAHAITKTLESQASESQFKDAELEDEATMKQRDKKAFTNMPKEFFEWRKKRGEV
jgi:DNA repair exonuclease SbcCD ATPase subunit